MKYTYCLLLLMALTFVACDSATSEDSQSKTESKDSLDNWRADWEKRLRGLHDEVMPKTSVTMDLKLKLQDELERAERGVGSVYEKRKKAIQEVIEELTNVNNAMSDWMREYANIRKSEEAKETMVERFKKSQQAMDTIKTSMKESIEKAQEILADSSAVE